VVDFTVLSDEEVQQFFIHQKEGKVCGRFKQEQLHRIIITLPTNILQITMPRWKQFLTACLLAFSSMLFSCDALIDNNVKGEPVTEITTTGIPLVPVNLKVDRVKPIDTTINCTTLKGDTIFVESTTQGDISYILTPPTLPTAPVPDPGIAIADTTIDFPGDVIIDTIPPVKKTGSTQIKNPPKADSTDCNNMKYY
jgi:hypothetical protein